MRNFVRYFASRPAVANVMMFGLILSAIFIWNKIGKEEMPEFAMNWIRISIPYPGAPAEDVELFITKIVEEKLKGVTGLEEVSSTSAYGVSSFRISFLPNTTNLSEKIQEVKDAVESVQLPREAEEPVYRQFRSAEKAILDIGIYLDGTEILSVADRIELQKQALAFKDRLLSLKEVSGVDSSGYLRPELHIKIDPDKLQKYEISMNQVKDQITQQHVRRPIGSMKDEGESEITIVSELEDIESLNDVIVVSGFQGQRVLLSNVARIEHGFERSNSVVKVQGREGIIFNVQKSSNVDILSAQEAIVRFIEEFQKNSADSPVRFVLMDDESYDVSNRISLIARNGLLGFALIVLVLFMFLDFKSGIWVGMGIPFSLAFTLVVALVLGYTVNNMTLAAIIIVLGIVVDDAIIVAENIVRKVSNKVSEPATEGTTEVISPVIASVLTTCAAFIPLAFFSGHFGMFVKYIPAIVFAMLFASLIESFCILPAHMISALPFEERLKNMGFFNSLSQRREDFIHRAEGAYARLLRRLLPFRFALLAAFLFLLIGSILLFTTQMRYVMFPREETRNFAVKVVSEEGTTRQQMARKVRQVEDVFLNDQHQVVIAVRTTIGQSRRGGEVRENEATLRVEILPPSEREITLNELFRQWQTQTEKLDAFEEIRFLKSRYGSSSGSPIVIEIQENNDSLRRQAAETLKTELEAIGALTHVEIERPITRKEYQLNVKKEEVSPLGINYEQLSSTLRAYVEGDILYTINSGDEEVDVRFTSIEGTKDDISKLLNLTVANRDNYLVPLRGLVEVVEGQKPANIQRINFKRTVSVYADLKPETRQTPLELAEIIESNVFPKITQGSPSTILNFRGEIEDSRESQSDFAFSLAMVLLIIFVLLVFLFNSVWTPLLIGSIIPFGIVGVVVAFWTHGMSQYGFFAVIGTLGMIGVVINDSIVLVNKLETQASERLRRGAHLFDVISKITSTRLRAVVVTTLTTVAGLFPTAYGFGGYDSMLAEMMLAMGWGLIFGMFITLLLVPSLYSLYLQAKIRMGAR